MTLSKIEREKSHEYIKMLNGLIRCVQRLLTDVDTCMFIGTRIVENKDIGAKLMTNRKNCENKPMNK